MREGAGIVMTAEPITVQKCSAPSAYSRILKVGRTIADLEGYEDIQPAHYGARFPE